jgi:sugar lactone lactonase YvrE
MDFTCISDLKCRIGECPVYDERTGTLFLVDILSRRLFAFGRGDGEPRIFEFESEVASFGLAASGRLVIALRHFVILLDLQTGARRDLCSIEEDRSETRLNDGKVGPDGAFWVGSMDDRKDKQPIGSLYRVDGSGRVERKVDGLTISNGLAWTAEGETMFHADSRGPWIDRWRFDRHTGAISERSRFAEPTDIGRPDGGACDAEGFYWSAGVSAGNLNRFAPDGSLASCIRLPVHAPTMPCFGGPDFRTLYLTTLREGRPAEELERLPLSGGLFAAQSPVAGFAPWRFLDT